jgi:DNA-binding GntR family transcriptional regulator
LEPGAHLSEPKLAAMFGVSRTPVREAIRELVKEHLVRYLPGRGAFVAEVSVPDLIDLYNMRAALEPFSSRLAARAMQGKVPTSLPLIRKNLLEAAKRINPKNNDAYLKTTDSFDLEVVRLANSPRLEASLRQVWAHVYRGRKLASSNIERLQESAGEHIEMIDAVLAGDEDRAFEITLAHALAGMRSTVSTIERYGYRLMSPAAIA